MTHVRIPFFLLVLAALAGCEDTPSEVIDLVGAAPVLRSTSVSPSSFNLDNQQMTGSVYRLSTTLSATASDPQGVDDIQQVQWSVFAPSGAAPIAQGVLIPGVVNGSGVRAYASTATFEVERSGLGDYRLELLAVDGTNFKSSVTLATLKVHLNDAPPVLSLAGARQVASAGSDSSQFVLSVHAADASGLSDVAQVSVRVLASRDSSARAMFDDGSRSHADAVAGDGIFTTVAWVQPTTVLEEMTFEYRAADRAGSASNILRRSANNMAPRFISFNIPSVIQRPASGTSLVLFAATVSDINGLSDIDSVYFMNLSATTPAPFSLFDDGDLTAHGDSVASDGTYSVRLSITSSNTPGVKDFRFSVVDRAGARVDSIRQITIN